MKIDIGCFVAHCLVCQQVKAEPRLPMGKHQNLPTPLWKWENIWTLLWVCLDHKEDDAIWVVADRLMKTAHFMLIHTWSRDKLEQVYLDEIVCLHRVPTLIMSDWDPQFVSQFRKNLHDALGTRLDFSTAFHPLTEGYSPSLCS